MTKMLHSWVDYPFYLAQESILNQKIISNAINALYNHAQPSPNQLSEQHILILFRIVTKNNIYKTVGPMKIFNITPENFEQYKKYILEQVNFMESGYSDLEIIKIVFSYGLREGQADLRFTSKLGNVKIPVTATQNYMHYKLPVFMDPLAYGNIIFSNSELTIAQSENGNTYHILQNKSKDL